MENDGKYDNNTVVTAVLMGFIFGCVLTLAIVGWLR